MLVRNVEKAYPINVKQMNPCSVSMSFLILWDTENVDKDKRLFSPKCPQLCFNIKIHGGHFHFHCS